MTNLLRDGFSTIYTLAVAPNIALAEISVKPPGGDAGGAIALENMLSIRYRAKGSKQLITLTDMTSRVAYDPAIYNDIIAALGRNTLVTVTYPTGATLQFYGWLDKFEPGELVEGQRPEATITIIPSNVNGAGAESAPAYTAGTTTTTTTPAPVTTTTAGPA